MQEDIVVDRDLDEDLDESELDALSAVDLLSSGGFDDVDDDEVSLSKGEFFEKVQELCDIARKKENVLDYSDITAFFDQYNVDSSVIEMAIDSLEREGVDVINIEDDEEDIRLTKREVQRLELSIKSGIEKYGNDKEIKNQNEYY